MSERSKEQIRELLDSLYRVDSGRILATLIRLLGDFDLAEEAMHEAFAAGATCGWCSREVNESSGQVNVRSNLMASPRAGADLNFDSEEHTCQGFESRDLVFRWTVSAQE
jgi:hypothetical protein